LDCLTGEVILLPTPTANTASTIKLVKHLQAQDPNTKLALIWDGASYHRSAEFREFLAQVNQGEDWQVHCLRFAPYAPAENPIENIWGQLKHSLRQMYQRCCSFKVTKKLFEILIQYQLFTLPNLSTYGAFSILI
jgi:transposase